PRRRRPGRPRGGLRDRPRQGREQGTNVLRLQMNFLAATDADDRADDVGRRVHVDAEAVACLVEEVKPVRDRVVVAHAAASPSVRSLSLWVTSFSRSWRAASAASSRSWNMPPWYLRPLC